MKQKVDMYLFVSAGVVVIYCLVVVVLLDITPQLQD